MSIDVSLSLTKPEINSGNTINNISLQNIQQQTALLSVLEIIGGNANIPIEKLSVLVGQGIPLHQAIELLGVDEQSWISRQARDDKNGKYLQTILNLSKSSQLDTNQLLQLAKQLDNDGQTMASLAVCALLNGEAGLINAPQYIRDQAVQLKNAVLAQGKFTGLNLYRSVRDVGHAAQNPYTIASLMVAGMAYRVVKASIASAGLGESAVMAQAAKVSGVVVGTNVEAGVFTVSQMLPEVAKGATLSWQALWAAYQQNLVMVASLKTGGALFGKAAETAHGVSPVGAGLPRPQLLGAETAPLRADNFIHATRGLEFAKGNIAVAQQAGSFTGMLASNLYGNPNLSWAENITQAGQATVAYGLASKMGAVAAPGLAALGPQQELLFKTKAQLLQNPQFAKLFESAGRNWQNMMDALPQVFGPQLAAATAGAGNTNPNDLLGIQNLFFKGTSNGGGGSAPSRKPAKAPREGLILKCDPGKNGPEKAYHRALKTVISEIASLMPELSINFTIPEFFKDFINEYDVYQKQIEALKITSPRFKYFYDTKMEQVRQAQYRYVLSDGRELTISEALALGKTLDWNEIRYEHVSSDGYPIVILSDEGKIITNKMDLIHYVEWNTPRKWNQDAADAMKRVINQAKLGKDGRLYVDLTQIKNPILFFGATGAYGRPIAEALLGAGANLYAVMYEADPYLLGMNGPFLGTLHALNGIDLTKAYPDVAKTASELEGNVHVIDTSYGDGAKAGVLWQAVHQVAETLKKAGKLIQHLTLASPTTAIEVDEATWNANDIAHQRGKFKHKPAAVIKVGTNGDGKTKYLFDGAVKTQGAAYQAAQMLDKSGKRLVAPAIWSKSLVDFQVPTFIKWVGSIVTFQWGKTIKGTQAWFKRLFLSNIMYGARKEGLQDSPLPREAAQVMSLLIFDQLLFPDVRSNNPQYFAGAATSGPKSEEASVWLGLKYTALNFFRRRKFENPPRADLVTPVPGTFTPRGTSYFRFMDGGVYQVADARELSQVVHSLRQYTNHRQQNPLAQAIAGGLIRVKGRLEESNVVHQLYDHVDPNNRKGAFPKLGSWLMSATHEFNIMSYYGFPRIIFAPLNWLAQAKKIFGSFIPTALTNIRNIRTEDEIRVQINPVSKTLDAVWVESPNGTTVKYSNDGEGIIRTDIYVKYAQGIAPTYTLKYRYNPTEGSLTNLAAKQVNIQPHQNGQMQELQLTPAQEVILAKTYGLAKEDLSTGPMLYIQEAIRTIAEERFGVNLAAPAVIDQVQFRILGTKGTADGKFRAMYEFKEVVNATSESGKYLGELVNTIIYIKTPQGQEVEVNLNFLVKGNWNESNPFSRQLSRQTKPTIHANELNLVGGDIDFKSREAEVAAVMAGLGDSNLIHLEPIPGRAAQLKGTVVAGINALAQIQMKLEFLSGKKLATLNGKIENNIRHGERLQLRYVPENDGGWYKYELIRSKKVKTHRGFGSKTVEEVVVHGLFKISP